MSFGQYALGGFIIAEKSAVAVNGELRRKLSNRNDCFRHWKKKTLRY